MGIVLTESNSFVASKGFPCPLGPESTIILGSLLILLSCRLDLCGPSPPPPPPSQAALTACSRQDEVAVTYTGSVN